jgi:creatinine amidohydrolase
MAVHEWASLSWPAFRALSGIRTVAVLPLGALEAHGPHLPLGTDVVIAEAMARAGAERVSSRGYEVVVLPALAFAPAPFAADFAGTIDTPPGATAAMIHGVAASAARHGVAVTVIANAHHDPAHVAPIREAVAAARPPHAILFPDLTRRRWASRLTDEFRSGACHAGRYEGSVLLAAAPHLVDVAAMQALPANPRSLVDAIQRGDRTFAAAGGPDAYFGWPADATADEGRAIIDALAAIVEEAVEEYWQNEDRPVSAKASAVRRSFSEGGSTKDEERNEERQDEERMTTERERADARRGHALTIVNPPELPVPRGFSHGIAAPSGWTPLHVAGQTAADAGGVASGAFAEQFERALARVLAVVRAGGGGAQDVARMTVYVTRLDDYRAGRAMLSEIWRRHMGRHYPAMALVEVSGLVDTGALVEIEADAHVPPGGRR